MAAFLIKVICLYISIDRLWHFNSVHATFYATTNTVRNLTRVEQFLIPALIQYRLELQSHYDSLKSLSDELYLGTVGSSNSEAKMTYQSNLTIIDVDELASEVSQHPFKSLQLVERFVNTWPRVQNLIKNWTANNEELKRKIEDMGKEMELPGQEAIIESMTSLIKLKRTYDLPTSELLQGRLKEFKTKCGLGPEHCYELGRFAMRYQIFTETIDIIVTGLNFAQQKSRLQRVKHGECHQQLKTQVELDLESLLKTAIERHDLKLKNGNFTADKNPFHFVKVLEAYPSAAFDSRVAVKIIPDISRPKKREIFRAYENICNGKSFKTPEQRKSLVCKLEYRRGVVHPYFQIQPLKVEYHHKNPPLVQIHDVLSSREIAGIIKDAKPRLGRSLVVGENATNQAHFGRTSSNTFINDYDPGNPFHYISRRIEMMVGLRASILDASEDMQVANYGPGEFYGPHFDAGDFDEDLLKLIPFQKHRGDRLATFMIYLNSVKIGGATAFPRLGISVKPKKGSGVLWYNLRHDGSQEPLSLHAGCPVLYGTKWIANKWIRANEQTFIRKCPLVQPPKTI